MTACSGSRFSPPVNTFGCGCADATQFYEVALNPKPEMGERSRDQGWHLQRLNRMLHRVPKSLVEQSVHLSQWNDCTGYWDLRKGEDVDERATACGNSGSWS